MFCIGKYKFGYAPLSMVIVFIVLSISAILSAFNQAKPEFPMPLSSIIFINECMALLATLVYGIILHLALSLIKRFKSN